MIPAFTLLNISLILLVIAWRYPAIAIPYAVPFPLSPKLVPVIAIITALLMLIMIKTIYSRIKSNQPVAPLIELLILYPALYIMIWTLLPAHQLTALNCILPVGFFLFLIFCFIKDRYTFKQWGISLENFLPAWRSLCIPTLLFAGVLIISALFTGTRFRLTNTLLSLVTYPVFAVAQLMLFLLFPVQRLRQLTESNVTIILCIAVLFSIVHWPNLILIVACFFGMAVWAAIYLRHPNLYAAALSMGILATIFIQVLPADVTKNAVVGPHYVYDRFKNTAYNNVVEQAEHLISASLEQKKLSDNDAAYIEAIYTVMLNRPLNDKDFAMWSAISSQFSRHTVLKAFLMSKNFRSVWWFREKTWPRAYYTEVFGYLDRTGYEYTNNKLFLRGWAGNTITGDLPDAILVFAKGKLIYSGKTDISRQDVSNYFKLSSLEYSGFEFNLSIDGKPLSSIQDIRVFAVSKDAAPVELFYPVL